MLNFEQGKVYLVTERAKEQTQIKTLLHWKSYIYGGRLQVSSFMLVVLYKNKLSISYQCHAFQNCMSLFAQCVHWFHLCCLRTRKKPEWGWYRLYNWATVFTREKHKQKSSGVINILSISPIIVSQSIERKWQFLALFPPTAWVHAVFDHLCKNRGQRPGRFSHMHGDVT